MARMTKAAKAVEKIVDDAFYKYGSNRQFNVFDLAKISAAGRTAAQLNGGDIAAIEAAVKAACDHYEMIG